MVSALAHTAEEQKQSWVTVSHWGAGSQRTDVMSCKLAFGTPAWIHRPPAGVMITETHRAALFQAQCKVLGTWEANLAP